jgi:predicted peptidase
MDLSTEQMADAVRTGTFANAQGSSLAYLWLKPKDYDPSRKYPLVLFLHGAGYVGDDGERHVRVNGCDRFACPEFMEVYPCFVLQPFRAARRSWPANSGAT